MEKVLPGEGVGISGWGGGEERAWKAEYIVNTLYTSM
jgi:hypothetical protein